MLVSRVVSFHRLRNVIRQLDHTAHSLSVSSAFSTGTASKTQDVVYGPHGKAGRLITLNRPRALNALNLEMVRSLTPEYCNWNSPDSETEVIVMIGSGEKSFCAGGDIVAVCNDAVNPDIPVETAVSFFKEEYQLNYLIATSIVPQVALLDGITMGGGVGLSVHGAYRVATDRCMFAMPETTIGFFPDVGGTYFLPKLEGSMGMFLALTGTRLIGKEVHRHGIATHYVSSDRIPELQQALMDISNQKEIPEILNLYSEVYSESDSTLPRDDVDRCFSGESVDAIRVSLEKDGSEWAKKQLKTMNRMSPFSLEVTFRALSESRKKKMSLAECLRMEYRIATRFVLDGEFSEGVRALLIDKDQNPIWDLEDIPNRVDRCFQPFSGDEPKEDLTLTDAASLL